MDVSYFSGKLEAYLRYKEIPFRPIEATMATLRREVAPHSEVVKVPVVRTPQGEWLQDTTPVIELLETRHPEGRVFPGDPEQAFFARLLEDYADEWLWRPALHYRWSFEPDASLLGGRIARELVDDVPAPAWLRTRMVRRRQYAIYVRGDGVTAETRAHVESIYRSTLDRLEAVLAERPFLLGGRPCLADFGFFASMFRHFALDPTPSRIMRERSPRTWAWVARLWAARRSEMRDPWAPDGTLPDAWRPLLEDAATGYLPYLHANAVAWREGRRRFDWAVQGTRYRGTPVVQYRVWCRERLQQHFDALPPETRARVEARLRDLGGWEPLQADGRIPSRLHEGGEPPFCRPPARPPGRFAGTTAWNLPRRGRPRARATPQDSQPS
jgi:glutathione S-transferase